MNDKGRIIAGLAIFLVLATFPIWYTIAAAGDVSRPDLELPKDSSQCVEGKEYMTANHMDLLNQWRDAVVREGKKDYTSKAFGKQYEMSLTKTCMRCHKRETFCYECHDYANVKRLQPLRESATTPWPQGGVRCWDCHVEPKGN